MKTICLGLVLATLLGSALPAAAAVSGGCNTTATKFQTSALDFSSTSSSDFTNLPEASVSFLQGKAGCVRVTFSSDINPQGHPLSIRAFLDDTTAGLPAEWQFSQTSAEISAHSFTFIFKSVAAGHHTLRMQFVSGVDGMAVLVRRHNTVVDFIK
jgi:hypothetical protein